MTTVFNIYINFNPSRIYFESDNIVERIIGRSSDAPSFPDETTVHKKFGSRETASCMEDDAKRVRPLHQAKRWPRTTRGREREAKNWQTSKVGLWPAIGPESSRRQSERVLERKGLSSTGCPRWAFASRCVPHVRSTDEHHRGTIASSAGILSRLRHRFQIRPGTDLHGNRIVEFYACWMQANQLQESFLSVQFLLYIILYIFILYTLHYILHVLILLLYILYYIKFFFNETENALLCEVETYNKIFAEIIIIIHTHKRNIW